MKLRLALGRFLIRIGSSIGSFISSLPVSVLKPDDLVDFSRQAYTGSKNVGVWASDDFVDDGLNNLELNLLDRIPIRGGRILVLGVGGGREAIHFAKIGFEVTGLDFVSEMVKSAVDNACQRGLKIEGLVQEMSKLEVTEHFYDIVWMPMFMYSCIPTRKRRIKILRKIKAALKISGYFVCQFKWNDKNEPYFRHYILRKVLGIISLGNFWYEKGDILWRNVEFLHIFSSEDQIKSEFRDGGFEAVYIRIPDGMESGEAILKST